MGWVVVIVIVVAVVVAAIAMRGRSTEGASAAPADAGEAAGRVSAPVAEFHVRGSDARVSFDVPLPDGDIDEVLQELLIREAVEVVREKRHTLPITEVQRVVALGRRGQEWHEVGSVSLETPGQLPPPILPELIPHHVSVGFDPIEQLGELPSHAPGLAESSSAEGLAPLAEELRLPSAVESGLRAQGVDPAAATAGDVVLGIMRMTGYSVVPGAASDTHTATRSGQRIFLRVVDHAAGDHPELSEAAVRTFAVDFVESGAHRGLLITEKYSPFMIYDREKRDPRMRFITRERLQLFVDGLALG